MKSHIGNDAVNSNNGPIATVSLATIQKQAVSFTSYNLKIVGKILKEKFPNAHLTFFCKQRCFGSKPFASGLGCRQNFQRHSLQPIQDKETQQMV